MDPEKSLCWTGEGAELEAAKESRQEKGNWLEQEYCAMKENLLEKESRQEEENWQGKERCAVEEDLLEKENQQEKENLLEKERCAVKENWPEKENQLEQESRAMKENLLKKESRQEEKSWLEKESRLVKENRLEKRNCAEEESRSVKRSRAERENRVVKMSKRLNEANERVLPLFFPCSLLVVGVLALLDLQLVDPALLESANWKQNTIWCVLLLFGLLPPNMRAYKITWMGIGYLLAFFILGGANVFGTVKLMMSVFKVLLPVLILFQAMRLWMATERYERLALLLPLAALAFAWLLYPIEDRNIVQSGWRSLLDWSLEHYRDDSGFHTYVGAIALLAGLTECTIVVKYLLAAPSAPAES